MGRQISGNYSISSSNTSEKAIDAFGLGGNRVTVENAGSNIMYVGNDGSDAVDNNSGYPLDAGESVEVALDNPKHQGRSDLYVYGTSGDTLKYIVTE